MSDQKTEQGKRRARVPFSGHRTKLQLSDEDAKALSDAGWVPRWINDQDGRVQRAQAGGYEFVKPEEATSIGQFSVVKPKGLDGKVSMIVSKGSATPITAYLMKIQKEFWVEDQDAKEEKNRRVDDALKAGRPGGVEVENQYVPKGHEQQI